MSEVLEFNPESQYKLRLTDGGDWAPTEITSGAVHQAKNLQYSVIPEWFDDAPESAEGVEVKPTADGSWGVFKGGEQIGAMSDDDVKPLEKSAIPSGAPEPKAAPAAPATAPSAAKDGKDDDSPRRAASIGPDEDDDGWVDGKEPLEPGSVDMPPLISGRNIDQALKNYSPKMPGKGLQELLLDDFLPRTGEFDADEQIRAYEDSHLSTFNELLEAPEKSFMTGPILHNLAATEDAGERAAEVLSDARGDLENLYAGGVGDPTLDARMQEVAGTLSTLTETGEAVQRLGQGLARNGDAYNSISSSMSAGVQDAFSQIKAYAEKHDRWESSGSSAAEPRPDFSFLTTELEEAVGGARDLLEGNISSETMLASATLDPAAGGMREEDGGRGTPNEGGSTPAGGEAPAPAHAPAPNAPQQGGSTPVASPSSGSSEEPSSGKTGGPSREAAEKLAGLISGSSGGAAPQPGGMAPQPAFQQAPQQPFPMPNVDPGAAAQAMPAAPVSAPASGLIETEDPYEALLNPATHLTRDFEAGDMSQIREGNATGRDAAAIRPYTAEARSADSMLTSPPAAGPGAATPRPTALGADLKPLDKDGDGKVDDDAVPATKENVTGEEVKTAVMIDGEEHPVKLSDPRLLEMMNLVGEATEEEPLEILEAASEAGIELESYGEMLEDPTEAKAGDVVISTKGSGFYLGEGEVLLESGEVVPLSEVLELRPPQSGIFRLELPELPDDVDTGDGDEDQEPEDTAEPSEGGEAPPAEDGASAEGEPAEPAAPAEGGAAPAPEPAPEVAPEVLPAAGFEAGEMPDPAIAAEFQDLDGDGIPDDNNGNGLVDELEPLPEAPVAEEPAPAPAPEDQEPEPEAPEPPEEKAPEDPEPIFEGSASLDLDATGLTATGEATARIEDIPFEGTALGSKEQR